MLLHFSLALVYWQQHNPDALPHISFSHVHNFSSQELFSSYRTPVCPEPVISSSGSPVNSSVEDLKNCFDDKCLREEGEEACYALKSCTWCVYSKSKSVLLQKPFCTRSEFCYGGVKGWCHISIEYVRKLLETIFFSTN